MAIAAQYGCKLLKSDTKQAFLNGEIGDEKIYIRPQDWWPEPVAQGHALLLMNACTELGRQPVNHGFRELDGWNRMTIWQTLAVNNEKTIA